jgi:hypothetical protein
MVTRPSPVPVLDGPRHSPEWYDQRHEPVPLRVGDKLFVPCEGGPSTTRLETYPPRLELHERGGSYILIDEGLREEWRYLFVPDQG